MTRILLGQLASNGDCLYATAIARQIKQDFPGCHLTWAISGLCRRVLDNNPDVDEVWEVPMADWSKMAPAWTSFERQAQELADAGRFDRMFLTQIYPARLANYDGTVRPSIFRNYGRPLTVPVEVTIRLDAEEIAGTDVWFASTPAADASQVVLFECSSKSGQSFMTLNRAVALAEAITRTRRQTAVIISTHESFETDNPRIISGRALSIRQVARLTEHVDLFVGCGSGLTVAATSEAAKPGLPNIQILRRETSVYASFRHDFAYFGKPTEQFMELTSEDPAHLEQVLTAAVCDDFAAVRARFDDPVPLTFGWYLEMIQTMLVNSARYVEAMQSLMITAGRYGWHPALRRFALHLVLPFLQDDPLAALPQRKAEVERFKAAINGAQRTSAIQP
jgi:hypothetical protein